MVKGLTRRVVIVDTPDPNLFEQAIFIVRNEAFAKEGVSPQIFCLADDARTALMWAEAELGVAIVPQSAYRIMPHHKIIFAELCEPALRTRLAAISKKGASLSWPAQKFLEIFASVEPGR